MQHFPSTRKAISESDSPEMDTARIPAPHNKIPHLCKDVHRRCDFSMRAGSAILATSMRRRAKQSAVHRCRSWSTWEKKTRRSGPAPPTPSKLRGWPGGPGRAHDACRLRAWALAHSQMLDTGRNPGHRRRKVQELTDANSWARHTQSLCSPWEVGNPQHCPPPGAG